MNMAKYEKCCKFGKVKREKINPFAGQACLLQHKDLCAAWFEIISSLHFQWWVSTIALLC